MNKNNKAVSAKITNQDIIDLINKRCDAIEVKIEEFDLNNKLETTRAARWLETMMEHNHGIALMNLRDLMNRSYKISDALEDLQAFQLDQASKLSTLTEQKISEQSNAFVKDLLTRIAAQA